MVGPVPPGGPYAPPPPPEDDDEAPPSGSSQAVETFSQAEQSAIEAQVGLIRSTVDLPEPRFSLDQYVRTIAEGNHELLVVLLAQGLENNKFRFAGLALILAVNNTTESQSIERAVAQNQRLNDINQVANDLTQLFDGDYQTLLDEYEALKLDYLTWRENLNGTENPPPVGSIRWFVDQHIAGNDPLNGAATYPDAYAEYEAVRATYDQYMNDLNAKAQEINTYLLSIRDDYNALVRNYNSLVDQAEADTIPTGIAYAIPPKLTLLSTDPFVIPVQYSQSVPAVRPTLTPQINFISVAVLDPPTFQFAYGSISFPTPSFDPATASRASLEKVLMEQYEYEQSDIDDIVNAAVEPIDAQIAVLQGQIAATSDQNVINALQAQINALQAQKPEAIRQALANAVYAEQRNDLLKAGYPPSLVDGTYPKMRVDELGQPIRDGFGELIFDAAPTFILALAVRDFRRGIIAALSTLQLAMKGVTGFLDKIDIDAFIDLFRSLFSRGAVTVETLESASASAGTTGSAPTAGFASFVASLSNPNLQGILGQSLASSAALLQYLNVALKDGTVTPVTTNLIAGLVTALIGPSVVAEALKNPEIREFILNSTDADSSGESLAALVATVQAIVKLVQEGRFKDDITALLENTPPFSSLPEGERQAFLETVGNLVNYSILYAAGQDLAAAVDSPTAVLAQSQVELALGQLGGAPELNEVLQDALEASNQEALQYELTDAFTDVLVNGGISGDASKALAIRFATGLFAADDPAAFLREALGNAGVEGSLADEVNLAALLVLLFPTNAPDDLGVRIARRFSDDVAAEAERASRERVVEQTREILQGKNFDAPLIDQVLGLVGRDRSFAAQVASLSTLVDPKTVSQIIGTLRDVKLTTSLSARLAGELGDGAAGALASYALNSINSIENILRNTLNESLGSGESGQERGSKRLAKELFKEKIGPKNLENYTKLYIAAIGSIWGEGLIPQNVNMRTDIDRPGISIAA